MTNSNVHILHRHHAHSPGGAVGVGVNHQIQAGEVANDQVGKVAKPQITRCHLVGKHAAIAVDQIAFHDEQAGACIFGLGLQTAAHSSVRVITSIGKNPSLARPSY